MFWKVDRKGIKRPLAFLIIMALALGGCSGQGSNLSSADKLVIVDQAGREVGIAAPVERIVSGYYISSSVCIALGAADKLVGIEARAESRPIYALSKPELIELPSVGTAKDFNIETCLSLKPDLVILPYRLRDVADVIGEMGIPAIVVNPESYQEILGMIDLIGQAIGAEDRAESLISWCEETCGAIHERVAGLSAMPVVYMCGVGSWLTTASNNMYQTWLIEMAGGVSASGAIDGSGWTEISYEQLLAMDPEVMIIPSEADYDESDIFSDSQLAGLAAVREGRIYKTPSDYEAWDSPVPSSLLGARWLAGVLHDSPDSSKDALLVILPEALEFYREFYNI